MSYELSDPLAASFAEAVADHRAGRLASAEAAFRAALAVGKARPLTAIGLGQCLMRLGRDAEALAAFERAATSDDPLILTRLADALWEFNLWQMAIAALEKVVHQQPDNPRPRYNLAEAHLLAWQLDQALATNPRQNRANLMLGSFNNVPKITPSTVHLWSAVLAALSDARLLLKAPSFQDRGTRERYPGLFAEQDVARERIELRGPSELGQMMREYHQIDIGLDPTPFNRGTTTFQALWMGGAGGDPGRRQLLLTHGRQHSHRSRPGRAGRAPPGGIRGDRGDPRRRSRVPGRAQAGATRAHGRVGLCDTRRYTRNLEAAYRRMWRRWARVSQR